MDSKENYLWDGGSERVNENQDAITISQSWHTQTKHANCSEVELYQCGLKKCNRYCIYLSLSWAIFRGCSTQF